MIGLFRETVKYELERNKPLVDRILSDITYQSADNLVDGLTKAEEEGYSYKHYYGHKNIQAYAEDYTGYSYYKDYYKGGGYVCPSDIFYGRPKRAINTYGKWKVGSCFFSLISRLFFSLRPFSHC